MPQLLPHTLLPAVGVLTLTQEPPKKRKKCGISLFLKGVAWLGSQEDTPAPWSTRFPPEASDATPPPPPAPPLAGCTLGWTR